MNITDGHPCIALEALLDAPTFRCVVVAFTLSTKCFLTHENFHYFASLSHSTYLIELDIRLLNEGIQPFISV